MPDETTSDDGDVTEPTSDVDAAGDSSESPAPAADSVDDADVEDYEVVESDGDIENEAAPTKPRGSHVQLATIAGLVLVLVLGGLTGWLGHLANESHQAGEQRNLVLQVGRQGALNLTTIDWQHADTDVQRILDSATGTFYDDFQKRSAPFIEVVKQAQSKSVGNITEAGLESESQSEAQVLVAVTVNTTNAGAPEQQPRSWRMRISVQKVNGEAKVSKVEFVP